MPRGSPSPSSDGEGAGGRGHELIPIPLGSNVVYALPAPAGVALIDAGPDYDGAWETLLAALAALGIAPGDVRTVLLTHAHLDHAGLAGRWQSHGARILAGRADLPALAMDAAARDHARALARREFVRHGVPADRLTRPPSPPPATPRDPASPERAPATDGHPPALSPDPTPRPPPRDRNRPPGFRPEQRYTSWPAPLRMTSVQADGPLDDGACLDLGGRTLRAITCPGHTPGSVMLLDEATGALLTGDHILPRMAPTSGVQFEGDRRRPSLPTYLASLRASRPLAERVTRAYPGHGDPIADLGDAVDWTVSLLEQRARRTLARLRPGPGTAYEIALRLFPRLGPRHIRPVLAETLGLLDLLAQRGQALAEDDGEIVRWRAASDARTP